MLRIATWAGVMLAIALTGGTPPRAARTPSPRHAGTPPVLPVTARQLLRLTVRDGARATLVNVWAAWCVPCRKEFPALLGVARARAHEGLRLVLVSADFADQLPQARRFLVSQGVTDTSYIKAGDDMTFINALNPKWSGALPATFLYDRSGRLVTFWEGAANEARFQNAVNQVLASH